MSPLTTKLLIYTPLILHFLVTFGLAVAMTLALKGRSFNITSRYSRVIQVDQSSQQSGRYSLLQSDITTFLSAALVIVRMLVQWWCGVSGWRAAFILLEKGGITLPELSRLAQYQFPPIRPLVRPGKAGGVYLVILIAMILPLPAQLSAPVLSGSIAWVPSLDYVDGNQRLQNIDGGGSGPMWSDMQNWADSELSDRATGMAIRSWAPSTSIHGPQNTAVFRRTVASAYTLPINSTLDNIVVPYFAVDSLHWLNETELDALNPTLRNSIKISSTVLRYGSSGDNPMWNADAGTVAILKNSTWKNNPIFPSPITLIGEYYIALRIGWHPKGPFCSEAQLWTFGPESPTMAYAINDFSDTTRVNCYGFARIQMRAGAGLCRNCRVIAPSVVQNSSEVTLIPDAMTQEAINMLPVVAFKIARQNTSLVPCYNRMNEYVVSTLTQAYSGAWMSLTRGLAAPSVETVVRIPVLVSRAQVNSNRVLIWLGMHTCLTLSGIILLLMQSDCKHSVITEPALEPLSLDTSEVDFTSERWAGWSLVPRETGLDGKGLLGEKISSSGHKAVTLQLRRSGDDS